MNDLIDRQAAIDEATKDGAYGYMSVEELKQLPSAQPERRYDEWCTDCKEYDQEKHCCPRWNRVIRTTLQDAQPNLQQTCNKLATDCISILSEIRSGYSCFDSERPYYHALSEGIKALSQPERKKGKWLFTDAAPHRVYCSVCYKTFIPNKEWVAWKENIVPKKFCPNCGTRMEDSE